MDQSEQTPPFEELSVPEKILHVQDLWDRIAADPDAVPLTDAQREELDRRFAAHQAAPGDSAPWEVARARIRRGGH